MFYKKTLIALIFSTTLVACGGSSEDSSANNLVGDTANQVPTVDAGTNFAVTEKSTVELDGSASDSDGDIADINWTQTSGTSVQLKRPNQLNPIFEAPDVKPSETLVFELSVTDNSGSTSSDTVEILVEHINEMPTASFSESEYTADEQSEVEINATVSDSDGEITLISWAQVSGVEVSLEDTSSETLSLVAPTVTEETELEFELTLVDDEGGTTKSSIVVIVKPINTVPQIVMEQAIQTYPGSILSVAPVITDIDGHIVSAQWSMESDSGIAFTDTNNSFIILKY